MDTKAAMTANECSSIEKDADILCDKCKMLEISEAIHDIDSKLRDLEIALHINGHGQKAPCSGNGI